MITPDAKEQIFFYAPRIGMRTFFPRYQQIVRNMKSSSPNFQAYKYSITDFMHGVAFSERSDNPMWNLCYSRYNHSWVLRRAMGLSMLTPLHSFKVYECYALGLTAENYYINRQMSSTDVGPLLKIGRDCNRAKVIPYNWFAPHSKDVRKSRYMYIDDLPFYNHCGETSTSNSEKYVYIGGKLPGKTTQFLTNVVLDK